MTKLTLNNHIQNNITVVENEFIDRYMVTANGEYVKVYLMLLRHMNDRKENISVPELADLLECTEKDVTRALNYWQQKGLLILRDVAPEIIESVPAAPSVSSVTPSSETRVAPDETISNISPYRRRKDHQALKELLFVTETYLGRTLSVSDVDTINYFFDELGMSSSLIEYLIEYCVENNHKSMRYIQSVAINWHEEGITSVSEAKAHSQMYNKNCYSVLNAFGIRGRAPAETEVAFISRWSGEYGFSLDVILEACNRTMNAIHQPGFEYTDSILKKWKAQGVTGLKDIEALDADFQKEKELRRRQSTQTKVQPAVRTPQAKPTKFNNFEGRSYDMADLERRLVQQ